MITKGKDCCGKDFVEYNLETNTKKGAEVEIKKIDAYSAQAPQKVRDSIQSTKEEQESASGKEVSAASDRVQLSKGYQEMSQVKKVVMQRGELRTERLDNLRNMIENNSYSIKPEKIAEKMLKELW